MSASREKKQRLDPRKDLTQRERKEQAERQAAKRKTVLYTVIGVVVAILVAALLIWNSQFFQSRSTALTVNGRSYTPVDVLYYYQNALNQEYQSGYSSFDPQKSAKEQYVDAEQTRTYHDMFLESAVSELTRVAALEDAATEAGYQLTAEDEEVVKEQLASLKGSLPSGHTMSTYLTSAYGKIMTKSRFTACLERAVLLQSYQTSYQESVEVDDAAIEAYYKENTDNLDSFSYRQFFISGTPEAKTDESGAAITATDEEKALALSAAQVKAEAAVREIEDASDREAAFIEAAPKYVAETSQELYEDPDYSLSENIVGSTLQLYAMYGMLPSTEWLMDADRKAGDVTQVEADNGYYVFLFLNRQLDESNTADIRHVLIKATPNEDNPDTPDVDESKDAPSQEAMDAAKVKAQGVLDDFSATDKTAESFAKLAEEHSEDPGSNTNGGLYEGVYNGQMFPDFNDWILDSARQTGNTTLIENPQSGQQGWHVVYFQGWNEPLWKITSVNAIQSGETSTWLEELVEGYTATREKGIDYVK